MTQQQWKGKGDHGTVSGCVRFPPIDFFSSIHCSSLILSSEWGLMAIPSLHKKLPAAPLSQPLNLASQELGQAEESFVFRPWQEWKKIPTIRLCSIIQACFNGEGLMRNAAFEKSSLKTPRAFSLYSSTPLTLIGFKLQTRDYVTILPSSEASFLYWLCSKRSCPVIIIKCAGENIPYLPRFYERIKEKPILKSQMRHSCPRLLHAPLLLLLLTY